MLPFQDQEYEALPAEEKASEDSQVLAPRPRRSKTQVACISSVVAITALLIFLAAWRVVFAPSPANDTPSGDPKLVKGEETIIEHAIRAPGDQYLLGVGKADITGPVVELNFMGYADTAQVGTGLRQRIYSRAFIVGDVNNPSDRFVYLVLDTACGDTAIRNGIINKLASLGGEYSAYTQSNVAVTGTHSHSGPGAYLNYLLPQITSLGFSKQSYDAIVDGTVLSIQRAHQSLTPGYLSYAESTISDANINRSPSAYLANPAAERAKYSTDVDKALTMLLFQRASDGKNTGVLGWHSVHGTSMLGNNTHVSGDNKGLSAYLFEQAMKTDSKAAPGFVAAFSQSSVGDASPNVLGAWCDDGSGQQCSFDKSTCGGKTDTCHGRGPAFEKLDLGVSSCYEIARRVYQGAKSLYDTFDSVATPVKDTSVKAYHFFQDMRYFNFPLPNGTTVQTCPAALGYGFAGGTTDWPGLFDFTQGNNDSNTQNPFWQIVSGVLRTPSPEQKKCQSPKPILLDVGELETPYAWSPNIVDIQSFRVGQMIIIISPSEATTMTGRRWKAAVADEAAKQTVVSGTPKVVLGGPANTYAHYAATPEEYGPQRYEGASTLYGQWTSYAYIHLSTSNLKYLKAGSTEKPDPGPSPPDNSDNSISLISGVVYDNPATGKKFGDVITQPKPSYARGAVVNTTFVGANPRNNLRLEGTFASVEILQGTTWTQVKNDFDWHLVYTWTRDNGFLGTSNVVISWETQSDDVSGTYRVKYNGDWKQVLTGRISGFTATSSTFTLA